MEASLFCGTPPQGVWLEIQQNTPWHFTASRAWALLHSDPPTGPEQSLAALPVSLQLPPGVLLHEEPLHHSASSSP